ncbi:MAG: hypothetical protein ABWK04_00750 [Hydrogenobacter sp.]|uniref:hypothetical protein n=1 Tax=Hydrogenobacter thermophilus TaxID=940 RepID=UPI0030F9B16C
MDKVIIKVNGKDVKLKDFPKRVTHNVIVGLIKSLNLEEEPEDIVIHVKVSKEGNGSS